MPDPNVPVGYVQDHSLGSVGFYKVVTGVTLKRNEAYIDCIKDGARLLMPKTELDWQIIQRLSKSNYVL